MYVRTYKQHAYMHAYTEEMISLTSVFSLAKCPDFY